MRVLVCDDNAATRFVIRQLLSRAFACEIVECTDGSEALQALDREPFELLVLDLDMPIVSGDEVLKHVRRQPALRHLPVVMLSKERRETVITQLIELGVSAYVLKPPTARLVALVARIRQAGRSSRAGAADDAPVSALRDLLFTAVTDVIETMTGDEVEASGEASGGEGFIAAVDLPSKRPLVVALHCPRPTALALSARLRSVAPADVDEADCLLTLGKIAALIGGRLHSALSGATESTVGFEPRALSAGRLVIETLPAETGLLLPCVTGAGLPLFLSLRAAGAADPLAAATAPMRLPELPVF
ncbi:MAG TPA: response regulator [Vicinamibacterales bacterium]|nr:response regulator [Vicinamibacterales bacterium]